MQSSALQEHCIWTFEVTFSRSLKVTSSCLHAHYLHLKLSLHECAPVAVGRHPVHVAHLAPEAGALTALLSDGLRGGRR